MSVESTDRSIERLFPTLTSQQVERLAEYGTRRAMRQGETLMEPGDAHGRCFVVVSGSVEILRASNEGETLVHLTQRGQFSGEVNLLTGRAAFVRVRAHEDGEVVVIDRDSVLRVLQLESELGQILMRAFILRRVELIARGYGDAVLLGSTHCAGTLRLREFLGTDIHSSTSISISSKTSKRCSTRSALRRRTSRSS